MHVCYPTKGLTKPSIAERFSLRLMNGPTPWQGRVEIYKDHVWGTICDDDWDDKDARVVCRQLGYTGGTALTDAAYGMGTGKIVLDDVDCSGTESTLVNCIHRLWGRNNCMHNEDAGVDCG